MALPATMVWEVRPTNGTDDGGGGFDPAVASPGTDFSQQNATVFDYLDLVVGTPNTDVTSVAHPFDSTHVGNTLAIVAGTGWAFDFYNIRSVVAGVATLDKSPGATGITGGQGSLGGARKGYGSGSGGYSLETQIVSGNTIYVKKEAWNEAVALTVAGATGAPIRHIGYNANRDDIDLGDGNANNPVNDRNTAAGDGIVIGATATANVFMNINVTRAGDAGFSLTTTPSPKFINCRSYNNTGEALESGSAQTITMIGCELDTSSLGGQQGLMGYGNYFHDNTGAGWNTVANDFYSLFNIYDTNGSQGHNATNPTRIIFLGNTVYNTTGATGDGLLITTPAAINIVLNNIFANNARYGANATDSDSVFADYNDYNANGTAARNNFPVGPHDSTAAPTFTNAGAGDFSIGTNLKALGWPGAFPAGLSTGGLDMGAVQRLESGSAGMLYIPGMDGLG